MNNLDKKINEYFKGLVVKKDLVKIVKGNAIVPTYVLEYLLGQYCATDDEESIRSGIDTVKEILRKHYVHRHEAGLIKSAIKEKGHHKIIDKVSVSLNDKINAYEAKFSNLGIKNVLIDSSVVKTHKRLLVSGVWCLIDMEYEFTEDNNRSPWVMKSLKPIQLSGFDFEQYSKTREKFTTDEWIDLLIQSIGFNPEMLSKRSKLFQLARLIPYSERNYNLIELGPKGTGKSHIYSDFSPHGILISGGEVTTAKLFVNNSSNKIGLVGFWDTVAFDEFAGKNKKVDKSLVDIMKNYMANKSFSRGVETIGADASMVFVGNTQHNVPYMLKHSDLFDELPEKYHDSAFLDRLHFYIPGWEVDIIRGEMFSDGYGFVVDYLAEALRYLRNHDYSQILRDTFTLSTNISTRDRDGINKTFSGLMKIIYPNKIATDIEMKEILKFSVEGRKRVKDQLMRIDSTYNKVTFTFSNKDEKEIPVRTLEEVEYPEYYNNSISNVEESHVQEDIDSKKEKKIIKEKLFEGNKVFEENQKGVNWEKLFASHLKDIQDLIITDPYVRAFYQIRNLTEFLEMLVKNKSKDDIIHVKLETSEDKIAPNKQDDMFHKIQENFKIAGIEFEWEYKDDIHARHIVTDTGWKILLDRGLDIYQHYELNDTFDLSNRLPEFRGCKKFEITYLKEG